MMPEPQHSSLSAMQPSERFIPLSVLGNGAHSSVRLSRDMGRCGEQVAIKFIHRRMAMATSRYIQREVVHHRELSMYSHPNIVQFYEIFKTPTYLGIVMEFVDGVDLNEYLSQQPGGRVSEAVGRHILQQLVLAVGFCHQQGKSHRDIKMGNILVVDSDDGLPLIKLCDFGFCKDRLLDSGAKSRVGTTAFVAPEVILCGGNKTYAAEQADVWSCGVCLYMMLLTGHPFMEPEEVNSLNIDIIALTDRIQQGVIRPPPNPQDAASMPLALDLIGKMLVPDPAKRCTLEEVKRHPWFLQNLPQGSLELSERLVAWEPRQSMAETKEIIRDVCELARSLSCDMYGDVIF